MGPVHNKGLQHGIPPHALSAYKPHTPKFNKDQQVLIEQEVQKLKDKVAVAQLKRVPQDSFVSTLFLVPKKDGGQRPVINLKCLNSFVVSPHFKMEGIQTFNREKRRLASESRI